MEPEKQRSPRSSERAPARHRVDRAWAWIAVGLIVALGAAGVSLLGGDPLVSFGAPDRRSRADGGGFSDPIEPGDPHVPELPAPARIAAPTGEASVERGVASSGAVAADRWRVIVQVVAAESPPRAVRDATVTVALQIGGEARFASSGAVDELGRIERDLAAHVLAVPPLARGGLKVCATATAPGRVCRSAFADLGIDVDGLLLRIELERGAAVRGRVVALDGRPVADALLRAVPIDGARVGPTATTDAEGVFAIEVRESDRWRLHAAAFGVGSALSDEVDAVPGHEIVLPDLVVEGAGEIRGRVVDPSGNPVAGVLVAARAVSPDWPKRPTAEWSEREIGPRLRRGFVPNWPDFEPAGLNRCEARSDRRGEFRLGGLRDLHFVLATPEESSVETGDTHPHRIGDQGIELVVTCHRARVVVRDEAGANLPGVDLALELDGWRSSVRAGADGSVVIVGEPAQRLIATAALPGCRPVTAEHLFGDAHEEVELVLIVVPLPVELGALALNVVDRDGRQLAPATVSLFASGGVFVEGWYRRTLPPNGRIEQLPVGDYTLEVVVGTPRFAGFPDSGECRMTTVSAAVVADPTSEVTATVYVGGRLRLSLQLPAGVARAALGEAELVRMDGESVDCSLGVGFIELAEGGVSFGAFDFTAAGPWLSGALLDPGIHRLRFTAPGFRPLEHPFTIRAGEVADVALELQVE